MKKSLESSLLLAKPRIISKFSILLYLDEFFVIGEDGLIANTKRKLAVEFEMKDLGMMHYFIGMEVWQSADGISLEQGKYALEILKRFKMMDCKAMTTPMASNLKLFECCFTRDG